MATPSLPKNLQVFKTELQDAMKGVFPTGSAYTDVTMIMSKWSSTNAYLHALDEAIESLEEVFANKYRYKIEHVTLNSEKTSNSVQVEVTTKLGIILSALSPTTLVIYYYGSHGATTKEKESVFK